MFQCDDIVIIHCLDNEYDRDHRRSNIDGLSRHFRIICIDPPLTLFSLMKLFKHGVRSFLNLRRCKMPNVNIETFRPIMLFPYAISYRLKIIEIVNRLFLFVSLRKIRLITKGKKRVIFITCPQQTCILGTVDEDLIYYECCDLYSQRPGLSSAAQRQLEHKENFIVSQCDLIVTTSKELFDRMMIRNTNTYYIPNSADTNLFEMAMLSDTPVPDDLASIPRPWIGLIGYISELVDMDLLNFLADRHPDWSLIVIGTVAGSLSNKTRRTLDILVSHKNIYMLGYKQYELVPLYQKHLDVCLICYKRTEYTACIHPNKLSQYLSQNKNVVSTEIKELENYSGLIKVAKSHDEFELLIAESLRDMTHREFSTSVETYLFENTMEKSTKLRLELIYKHLYNN